MVDMYIYTAGQEQLAALEGIYRNKRNILKGHINNLTSFIATKTSKQKPREYIKEMPQSQTTDQLTAPRGRNREL